MDISVFSSMLSVTLKTDRRREGRKLRQYLAALTATIGPFAVGTILAWTSPVMPKLVRNETMSLNETMALNGTMSHEGPTITAEEGSWIGSIIAIGAIFGSLPASWGADFIGRKYAIASLAIPFVISWLMVMFGETVLMLMIARFIGGGVIGAVTATIPMYIGEIAEVSIRGELGSYIQLMVTLGIFYVYVIGPFVSYFVLNLCCLAVPVVFVVLFLIVAPETPLYLLRKNKRKEAERSLIILRGPDYDIVGELDEIQEQIDEEKKRKQSFAVLFTSRAVIRATIAVMGLLSFLSFSGINVVIFYAQEIFQAGGTRISPEWSAIIIGGMQVVMTYASGLLVDRAGRRVLLLVSDSVMAVCLFALGAFFWAKESQYDITDISWVPLVSLSVYISVFSLGFGPIPGIMMGELFSPEAKGVALGIVCILASVLEFFVVKGFHPLAHHLGMAWTITIFGINCLLGTLFVWFLVPETKNKSLQQIQDELSGKTKRGKKKNRNAKNGNAGSAKKRIVINSASANNVNNMMV